MNPFINRLSVVSAAGRVSTGHCSKFSVSAAASDECVVISVRCESHPDFALSFSVTPGTQRVSIISSDDDSRVLTELSDVDPPFLTTRFGSSDDAFWLCVRMLIPLRDEDPLSHCETEAVFENVSSALLSMSSILMVLHYTLEAATAVVNVEIPPTVPEAQRVLTQVATPMDPSQQRVFTQLSTPMLILMGL
eukprot:gene12717-15960_t